VSNNSPLQAPWKPGESGNPAGLTHEEATLRKLTRLKCARHADEIVEGLLKIFRDEKKSDATRIRAGVEILDRGLGKALQPQEFNILVDRRLEQLSAVQLKQLRQSYIEANPELVIEHKPEEQKEP